MIIYICIGVYINNILNIPRKKLKRIRVAKLTENFKIIQKGKNLSNGKLLPGMTLIRDMAQNRPESSFEIALCHPEYIC